MGQSEQTLKGPDLKEGVVIDSLKSGQKLLGHADGLPVLLVREGENFYAIGAKCSHYGADLNDGLMSDGIIRCPWHHACFDVKTGEATKAPALNPIPTWNTEIENGMVFVRNQRSVPPARERKPTKEHFVIIGSGAAGHAASEMLRRLGFSGEISILSADSDLPYDRPNLSKDYLAGNAPEEWMPLRSPEFFEEQKISIRLNSKVTKLNPKTKTLQLENGDFVHYDKCLIATGGIPAKPKIQGIDLSHVHFLRSFSDCKALIEDLKIAKKVVIVGAGFIGLEAAAALTARKMNVCIVATGQFPLERLVGPEVGAFLKSVHETNGIQFRLGRTVERIEKNRIILDDQSSEPADLVLVATGIVPSTEFLSESEIKIENGVSVDEYLETTAKDVFAAGDLASWPSEVSGERVRIEHWVVAQRMGQVAAANMMGAKKRYSEIPFFWSQQFDVTLNYVGHATSFTHTRIYGRLAERDCAVAYLDKDTVKAVLTIGRDSQNLEIERALENKDQIALKKILK